MFSVLVPSFEHARFLAGALLSALAEPLVEEVLVVDDGSRDGSRALIAQLAAAHRGRLRELPGSGSENLGAARRLEQLVAAARCDWLAVLNSDDAFAPGRFELLRHWCRGSAGLLCGSLVIVDDEDRAVGTKRGVLEPEYPFPAALGVVEAVERGDLVPLLLNQNFVATTSNMVFTRELHARVGGFRDYRYVHDWDFALRAAALGAARLLPHYLTVYRSHGANTIKEAREPVVEEVRRLLRDVLADFPHLRDDPCARAALRGNRYLDERWHAEVGIATDAAGAAPGAPAAR